MKNLLPILIVLALSVFIASCNKKATDKGQASVEQKSDELMDKTPAENQKLQKEAASNNGATQGYPQLPGYTPTGNPDVDAANYSKAKEDLYNNHPEQYQQWVESMQAGNTGNSQTPAAPAPATQQQITEIPYEQYMQMPQARRDYIDAHPELYKVVK